MKPGARVIYFRENRNTAGERKYEGVRATVVKHEGPRVVILVEGSNRPRGVKPENLEIEESVQS